MSGFRLLPRERRVTHSHETTYAYVVVASQDDLFAEMAAVSMATLRAVMPKARIVMLTDAGTAGLQTPTLAALGKIASDWIVRELTGMAGGVERSRHLKLKARALIDGHLVYLDSDTLIARDLSGMSRHKGDFAAAPDALTMIDDRLIALAAARGWETMKRYLNSGVFSVRDTPATRTSFEDAYAVWRQAAEAGFYGDQFALNVALQRARFPITWLPPSYNLQIAMDAGAAIRPHIFHVFSHDFANRDDTVLHTMSRTLKETGVLDEAALESFVRTGNPWTNPTRPKQFIALGRPVSAVMAKIRNTIGGR